MERRTFVRSTMAAAFIPAEIFGSRAEWPTGAEAPLIRLGSNENPLGVPESARRAIVEALVDGNRYPRENKTAVHARIAARHKVGVENVVLGNGSAEILQMVVQALTVKQRGARVVIADPTFEDVEKTALTMGAELIKVPLRADHSHDLERMQAATAGATGPVLAFICNPNNPTGTLTSCDAISQWINSAPSNVWFLVDEAYFEFVTEPGYRTFIPDALAKPNVMVCRTLSKIYGLAGIRLGYAIAHPQTAREITAFGAGTNINHLAIAAGIACLDDDEYVRRSLKLNADGVKFVYRTLDQLGLAYLPTHANFVMHRINGDLSSYITKMLEQNIRVGRAFPPMTTYNRVSIGLPSELEAWAAALRAMRRQGVA